MGLSLVLQLNLTSCSDHNGAPQLNQNMTHSKTFLASKHWRTEVLDGPKASILAFLTDLGGRLKGASGHSRAGDYLIRRSLKNKYDSNVIAQVEKYIASTSDMVAIFLQTEYH